MLTKILTKQSLAILFGEKTVVHTVSDVIFLTLLLQVLNKRKRIRITFPTTDRLCI